MTKISDLSATVIPDGSYEFPASKDGVTAKLTVQQVIDLTTEAVLDGAPESLNTLNELAAALDDDANFASTVVGQIAAAGVDLSTVDQDILPDADNTRDLGGPSERFSIAHIVEARLGGLSNSDSSKNLGVSDVIDGAPKCWAHIRGTSTVIIQDSFNISGVIDNGIGDYSFTIGSDFATADYAVVTGYGVANAGLAHVYVSAQSATSVSVRSIRTTAVTLQDNPSVMVSAFGERA